MKSEKQKIELSWNAFVQNLCHLSEKNRQFFAKFFFPSLSALALIQNIGNQVSKRIVIELRSSRK